MNDLHGILFAYRSDANLGELTRPRNTCSLAFGGRYRLIDFMLSNYVNVTLSFQSEYYSCSGDSAVLLEDMIADEAGSADQCVEQMYSESLVKFVADLFESMPEAKNPKVMQVVRAYFAETLQKALGKEDTLSMLDVVRNLNPEFQLKDTDTAEEIDTKKRLADNLYCNANSFWCKRRKEMKSAIMEYIAATV